MNDQTGKLFIVSTPIGNLEDITLRALNVLKEVDLIAAEDTRRTRGLLTHYSISKPLTSFNSYNEGAKGMSLLSNLINGKNIALVSDAGTPGISDPAVTIINLAIREGIQVIPIPGVSAAITALSFSGLASDRFFFEGFLPRKKGKRAKRITEWKEYDKTVIVYESPYRVTETLKEIYMILGDRKVAVAREMTKMFEEIIRGRLSEVIEKLQNRKIKGEFTIVVGKEEDSKEQDSTNLFSNSDF